MEVTEENGSVAQAEGACSATHTALERAQRLQELQQQLSYTFQQPSFLVQALTHRSFLQDMLPAAAKRGAAKRQQHNERLEFLGDAVLELVISDLLFARFPDQPEGQLSHWRSQLVNTHSLAELALQLNLGQLLRLGRGERLSGGAEKSSVLGNALEALLGALYLDGGYAAVFAVAERLFAQALQLCGTPLRQKDYKSLLQEHLQGLGLPLPDYPVLQMDGPAHARIFQVACVVHWPQESRPPLLHLGSGRSKRSAEQAAAQATYHALQEQVQPHSE
ncbi:MAG: ribonuclease III [Magnetococcales bacterium]|nr:ribonuclease III [Magnetococcales bacterium]MBF0113975.1 ribonuclease III [Magnetococcales bacterium]